MRSENEFIKEYLRVFPQAQPSIFQMELIEGEVKNLNAWKEALYFWAGNDYRAQSVFKMIEYYKEVLKSTGETECDQCGNTRRVTVNDFRSPCPQCRPIEERQFWKQRGRAA